MATDETIEPGAGDSLNGDEGVAQTSGSLVDCAEQALHNWLAASRCRQGGRLPPEHEVAARA